ncbi:DUF6491 family protein [Sphingorhabdus contaminans]|uniref:DUF6491 family protein n=1 Tax=Sphingorhabdus contaminans TaxID=1343899 RepID=UPI003CCC8C18
MPGFCLALLQGCIPADDPPRTSVADRSCFDAVTVDGFEPLDKNRVRVRLQSGERYDLSLAGGQCDADWTNVVALTTRSGRTLCTGSLANDAELRFRSPAGNRPVRCQITEIRRIPAP